MIKGRLTRFSNYLSALGSEINVFDLQARLTKFEPLLGKFEEIQGEIELLIDDPIQLSAEDEERLHLENNYYAAIAIARERLASVNGTMQNHEPSSINSTHSIPHGAESENFGINLPKINLPRFDGAYGDWIKFRDTFKSMIHDNHRLDKIQKFHYLNSVLFGEATHVIKNLGISEANYELAWSTLCSRYEDTGALRHHHVQGLFDYPALGKESYAELRKLIDNTNTHLLALAALDEHIEHWDTLIIYLLTFKLNFSLKREWEKFLTSHSEKKIKLKTLTEFLEKHCRYLQKLNSDKLGNNEPKLNNINFKSKSKQLKSYTTVTKTCAHCEGSHAIYTCKSFKELIPSARVQRVQELHLCFNCLSDKHQNKQCNFGPCKKCGKKHNNLLHIENAATKKNEDVSTQSSQENLESTESKLQNKVFNVNSKLSLNLHSDYVLLPTALVKVFDKSGKAHDCRVLLDPCSQAHIMTTELCNRLKLPVRGTAVDLMGIEGGNRTIKSYASIKLKSRCNNFNTTISCLIMDQISTDMPKREITKTKITIPKGIELADPQYNEPRPIDLLIGASLYFELECNGVIHLQREQPFFKKTLLGWIVAGRVQLPHIKNARTVCNLIRNKQLNDQLAKFWEIENCFSEIPYKDKNDFCERHFNETTKRDKDGRFIVSIPFKDNIYKLGDSKDSVQRQLLSIERSLKNNLELKNEYINFMEEYERLGHMTETSEFKLSNENTSCYLPHHIVSKESSTTTKRRVVFNGSKKTKGNNGTQAPSLNDIQHIGPTIQDDLFSIIIRFRQHTYVLTADIEKMYRQILIRPEDRRMQRILWRSDFNAPIKTYELNTVTYGTSSAPFLATRCLVQLAIDNEQKYPGTSKILQHDFYIDDMLTGANTIEEAQTIKDEVTEILHATGMELRKWASNEPHILQEQFKTNKSIPLQGDKDPKTLGLLWDPNLDKLKYQVNFTDTRKITKRTILSIIAQIFDPLGLVGPAIIQAKIIMQKLWSLKLNWEETVAQELHHLWINTYEQLTHINKIIINRHVTIKNNKQKRFHGFCDASEVAYGACIYVCSIDKHGERTAQLLCAKSRVAPLKATSIPRLELLGALLLAQLAHKVSLACKLNKDVWHFWSDSMVALAWIKSPSTKWKPFVASRVAEIQDLTNNNWNHVESTSNPADLISRGIDAEELLNCALWWHGPSWLANEQNTWPINRQIPIDQDLEQRKSSQTFIINLNNEKHDEVQEKKWIPITSDIKFERFSSLSQLTRTIAYVMRFIKLLRQKIDKEHLYITKSNSCALTVDELQHAKYNIVKWAQGDSFKTEIATLKNKGKLDKNSRLLSLSPFLDNDGILRVGGRLKNSDLAYNQKHPMILAPNHIITQLIIQHEHRRFHHAGCQSVLATLRCNYWIINGKNAVKRVLHKCVTCFRANPTSQVCTMGDLPTSRITPTRAFSNCGVDYAGPFLLTEKPRSKISTKAYMCIFVCFVTKAILIELATDLSTNAFINCLKRFISRRGLCKTIYSDNGTNFVGAKNNFDELNKLFKNKDFRKEIIDFAATEQIVWHFIPPRAPHFGGLWESAVKSAKRVVGETRLTFEELYTVLTQVEPCLNSRPLSPLSNDPNDLTPLTPALFLIGDSLKSLPQADVLKINDNRLNRYEHLQKMLQHFWTRWQREYLPQLQRRSKWTNHNQCIKKDVLVIIKEDNLPPMHWPLGRIVETHPGRDGHVRVVTVKTATGLIKRPISQICVMLYKKNRKRDKQMKL